MASHRCHSCESGQEVVDADGCNIKPQHRMLELYDNTLHTTTSSYVEPSHMICIRSERTYFVLLLLVVQRTVDMDARECSFLYTGGRVLAVASLTLPFPLSLGIPQVYKTVGSVKDG